VNIKFKVHAAQNHGGSLEIEVTDRFGSRPVRLWLAENGRIKFVNGAALADLGPYQPSQWHDVELNINVATSTFDVSIDGKPLASAAAFAEYVKSVERISFRTGPIREGPTLRTSTDTTPDRVTPNPDLPQPLAIYHIDDVRITPANTAPTATSG
jgi:hypothetical protein